jgi:hypothetical protein
MNQEDIIRMARKAGIKNDCDGIWCNADQLVRFANLVAEAKCEACARQLDGLGNDHCAAAIRLRGEERAMTPEALLLAEYHEALAASPPASEKGGHILRTAAELRRLHEENELLARACDKIRVMHREEIKPLLDVHSLNLELLGALKEMLEMWEDEPLYGADIARKAYAAIKKAEATE